MEDQILFVSISAPPKNAPESIQADRYLKHLKKKYAISLITSPVDAGWRRFDSDLAKGLEGVRVIELNFPFRRIILKALGKLNKAVFKKPDSDFWFTYMKGQVTRRIKAKPKLIYSRSTPYSSAILAYKLKQHYKVPWVLHLSDPWADNPFHDYEESLKKYHQHTEKTCFEAADIISLTSEKTIEFYKKKYPSLAQKFVLFNNVFDDEQLEQDSADPVSFSGKLRFVYTGAIYGKRSPIALFKALEYLSKKNPSVLEATEFVFVGNITEENKEKLEQFHLPNVLFTGPVSFNKAKDYQNNAHVLISIDADEPGEIFKVFMPSKLLDYMISRKTILALTPEGSQTAAFVNKGYGTAFKHNEVENIAAYIEQLLNEYINKNSAAFTTPEPLIEYSAKQNANNLINVFESFL